MKLIIVSLAAIASTTPALTAAQAADRQWVPEVTNIFPAAPTAKPALPPVCQQAAMHKAAEPGKRTVHNLTQEPPGKVMKDRWAAAPALAAARGDTGNRRLHHRWQVLTAHKKKHTIANTAIARELAGWCWSLAIMD